MGRLGKALILSGILLVVLRGTSHAGSQNPLVGTAPRGHYHQERTVYLLFSLSYMPSDKRDFKPCPLPFQNIRFACLLFQPLQVP